MKKLPSDIRKLINRLGEDELHALYQAVVERLKLLHKTKALFAMRDFQILERVYFDYHGEQKEGVVTRLNQRTITITLEWRREPERKGRFSFNFVQAIRGSEEPSGSRRDGEPVESTSFSLAENSFYSKQRSGMNSKVNNHSQESSGY